jgi:phosphatidylethanolamine N-methyltransferase
MLYLCYANDRPHMEKLYGAQIRREAGLTKSIKRATKITLPDNIRPSFEKTVKEVKDSVDKVVADAVELWEERVEKATPRVTAGVAELVRDLEDNLEKMRGRLTITCASLFLS